MLINRPKCVAPFFSLQRVLQDHSRGSNLSKNLLGLYGNYVHVIKFSGLIKNLRKCAWSDTPRYEQYRGAKNYKIGFGMRKFLLRFEPYQFYGDHSTDIMKVTSQRTDIQSTVSEKSRTIRVINKSGKRRYFGFDKKKLRQFGSS